MHSDLVPALYLGYGHETWCVSRTSSKLSNSLNYKRIGPTVRTQWQLSHLFFLETFSANIYKKEKKNEPKRPYAFRLGAGLVFGLRP
jgi:hypothetical protein